MDTSLDSPVSSCPPDSLYSSMTFVSDLSNNNTDHKNNKKYHNKNNANDNNKNGNTAYRNNDNKSYSNEINEAFMENNDKPCLKVVGDNVLRKGKVWYGCQSVKEKNTSTDYISKRLLADKNAIKYYNTDNQNWQYIQSKRQKQKNEKMVKSFNHTLEGAPRNDFSHRHQSFNNSEIKSKTLTMFNPKEEFPEFYSKRDGKIFLTKGLNKNIRYNDSKPNTSCLKNKGKTNKKNDNEDYIEGIKNNQQNNYSAISIKKKNKTNQSNSNNNHKINKMSSSYVSDHGYDDMMDHIETCI